MAAGTDPEVASTLDSFTPDPVAVVPATEDDWLARAVHEANTVEAINVAIDQLVTLSWLAIFKRHVQEHAMANVREGKLMFDNEKYRKAIRDLDLEQIQTTAHRILKNPSGTLPDFEQVRRAHAASCGVLSNNLTIKADRAFNVGVISTKLLETIQSSLAATQFSLLQVKSEGTPLYISVSWRFPSSSK